MKKALRWFTLVELLVVITILAIISVVAYQNFGGAVDKAVSGRKINDVTTIESALQQYKFENNFYPKADDYDASKNVWGYNSTAYARPSNAITVTLAWAEINAVTTASSIGGGKVYGSWTLGDIWAKGTISVNSLGKKYLSKDLYDPELWDVKVVSTSNKMIDYGIGRYVYAIYKKNGGNTKWTTYNLAYTLKEESSDTYITKVVWDYDESSCDSPTLCPKTLIWTLSWSTTNTYLIDWQKLWFNNAGTALTAGTFTNTWALQWIPYTVTDFKQ